LACLVVCLALGLCARPGPPAPPPYPTRAVPTIEPLPALSLDLHFADSVEWKGGGSAVLETAIVAGDDIAELRLSLDLPVGLAFSGPQRLAERQGEVRAGERRISRLPVAATGKGEFPVRLEAEARLADGRTFRVGQGATLRIGRPPAQGRLHNGAYEVRGSSPAGLRR